MDEVKKTEKAIKKFIDTIGQRAGKSNIRARKKPDGNTKSEKPNENINASNWVYGFVGDEGV